MEENRKDEVNIGIVKISDEVVSVIAGIAAGEIKGIVGMNAGVTGGITQIFTGKKSTSKGVKVNVEEESASIDIIVAVEYGVKIPEVISQVQENVKRSVESMTGLKVSAINVFVQNIIVQKPNLKNEEKED